jgi:hypothetical protein
MKTKNLILALCGLALIFAGCEKNKETTETLKGNVAQPTWTAPEKHDYTSSMTVIAKVNLKDNFKDLAKDWEFKENDLFAAFIGETCCGVGELKEGCYYLYVSMPNGETLPENPQVTLRYYSNFYTNLFEHANAFAFVNDARIGTASEPFVPVFVVKKP